jgi:hypothetical protein
LPVPAWLFYTLLSLLFVFGYASVQWQAGQYPIGTFYPFHVQIMAGGFYVLALKYYLDRYAHRALTRFRPALNIDSAQEAVLRYQLTALPTRPTLVATLAGGAIGALNFIVPAGQRAQLYNYADTPFSVAFLYSVYMLDWLIVGATIYSLVHLLRGINLIYTRHAHIDLFHRRPLYAFAWLCAFTAIGAGFPAYISIWTLPHTSGTAALINTIILSPLLLTPIFVFFLPLLGAHRLLAADQERLLDENQLAMKDVMQEIHQCASVQQLDNMETLSQLLQTLETEERLLKQIPTWPWQPEALQTVIATVLLPHCRLAGTGTPTPFYALTNANEYSRECG